jgi:hypothetical protein
VSRNVWQRHRLMATPGVPVRPAYAGGPNRDHRAVLGTVGFSHFANQGRRAHDVIDDRFHQMAFQVGCGDEDSSSSFVMSIATLRQSCGGDSLACGAAASLCMAEVGLGADARPDDGGDGRSAVLAMVTPPAGLRGGRDPGAAEPLLGQVVR